MFRTRGRLSRQSPWAYAASVVAVAAAAGVTCLVWPEGAQRLPIFFVLAAAVAGWYGGLGPGLTATVMSALAYPLLVPPMYSLAIADPVRAQLVWFVVLIGATLSVLNALRLRTQERFEAEHERLRVMLTSIGDGVISTDADGRVTFLNPVAEALTGWKSADAAGRPLVEVFRIVNEETRAPVEDPVARVLRTGHTVGLANHTVLLARDGREVPIDDSAAPIFGDRGKVDGVILVFHDATAAKKAERAVRQSEAWFRGMAEQAPVMVWMSDVNNTPRWFNRRWAEFVGRPVEQLVGVGFTAYVHPEDLEKIFRVSNEAYAARTPFEVEFRLKRHDGVYRWVVGRGAPVTDADGTFAGYCGTTTDETDSKDRLKTQQQLLEAERQAREVAEAAGRARDEFLAMLSHELRTPLTPVLAAVWAMEREYDLPPGAKEDLETLRRNVELEARLIDDLLDLTRVARNKIELQLEPVDVHAALRSALDIVRANIRERSQQVHVNLNAARRHVQGDAARLQQVFWNLLSNAAKFTGEGGTITVTTSDAPGGAVRVEVTDTGVGIDPADLPKVFDAFEQGGRHITRQFGGLGLGLAITKALTTMHGGRVWATSKGKGMGATFVVEFPTTEAVSAAGKAAPSAAASGAPLRVLLVEDHPDSARMLARLIGAMGHTVTVATSVATGLDAALSGPIDVLVSDMGLPDGTGIDLLRHLTLKKRVPAIALTGYGMEADVKRSLDAGFAMHLTKPVNIERLQAAIAELGGGP